jgi:Rha family phage regulatory protein
MNTASMNNMNLVAIRDNRATTTSLIVAEFFEKQHKDVLRAIENLLSDLSEDSRRNFAPRDYTDDRGKTWPMFEMSRDGFSLLAMGFTGKRALEWKVKFLKAFNQMEGSLSGSIVERVKSATGVFRHVYDLAKGISQCKGPAATAANVAAMETTGLDLMGMMHIRRDDRDYDNLTLFNGMVALMADDGLLIRDTFKGVLDRLTVIISPERKPGDMRLPSPLTFRSQLERLRPMLAEQGIEFEFGRHSNKGTIIEIEKQHKSIEEKGETPCLKMN